MKINDAVPSASLRTSFDLIIKGAYIVDGRGGPGFLGDIGVRGERIAALGSIPAARGHRVIAAEGLVASPGFVDIHSHSDYHLLLNPQAESSIRQGVTLEIGGNCGYSAAPIWGEWLLERAEAYQKVYGLDLPWERPSEYFAHLEGLGISVNFGLLMGHNTLRGSAMGGAARPPTSQELSAMAEAARQGMREGALGLSTGLVYQPACFAKPSELVALAKVVREEGGILTAHIRNEGDQLLEALQEILFIAKEAEVPLQISHLKTYRETNWGKLQEAFLLIEEARALGQDVTADRYPYTAANTGLQAVLPRWAVEGGKREQVDRLKDPTARGKIKAELREKPVRYWGNVMISEVASERNRRYEGLRLDEAASLAGQDPIDFVLDLLAEEEGFVDAIFFTMSEENLKRILQKPYVMIGSDSGCRAHYGPLSRGRPHPRTFGTFPRILGRYVREEGLLNLETAIKKMTWDPCRKLKIEDRGLLEVGCYADIVLFDREAVKDLATYEEPIRYPEGIRYVLVNGQITVEEGEHTGVTAGKVIREGR